MKMLTKLIVISSICLFMFSCRDRDYKIIEAASYDGLYEQRLGESTYYLRFPSSMFIEEARGKEGQLGYGIYSKDSVNIFTSSSGFIELERGRPIGGGRPGIDNIVEESRSTIMNKPVKWEIGLTETGRYQAAAYQEELTFEASSSTRNGLDSMIAIISTLSSR